MAVLVYLSDELGERLQKAADLEQMSLNELVEAMIVGFETNPDAMSDYVLTDEEAAIVNASIDEANQPGAVWYDDDESRIHVQQLIAERKAARDKAKGQGAA